MIETLIKRFNSPTILPQKPHRIALIGCGGISEHHLKAYKKHGLNVIALCDLQLEAACKRRDAFYPDAAVFDRWEKMIESKDIDILDIALHPKLRRPIIEAALAKGIHVLSQKPFCLDLDEGREITDLATKSGVRLAVNQNGRWAPYFRFLKTAINEGCIGDLQSISIQLSWDHSWIKGTDFEWIHHILLYDFGIHYFDIITHLMEDTTPTSIYSSLRSAKDQAVMAPLIANVSIAYENAIANLQMDASSRDTAGNETILLSGSKGKLIATGPICDVAHVELQTANGVFVPKLEGHWFPDGFAGSMLELIQSIEQEREPTHSASNNLKTLELTFAAIHSADSGIITTPGSLRNLGKSCEVNHDQK